MILFLYEGNVTSRSTVIKGLTMMEYTICNDCIAFCPFGSFPKVPSALRQTAAVVQAMAAEPLPLPSEAY